MFNRVRRRLDEQIHVEAHDIADEEPDRAQYQLPDVRRLALSRPEAKPLVHGVKHAVDGLDDALENGHDEVEESRDQLDTPSLPEAGQPIGESLLHFSSQARIEKKVS